MGNTKGATLLGTIKFLRRHRDAAHGLVPAELHHYLQQEIRPSAWYPTPHFRELLRAAVALVPGDRDTALERYGEAGAREHAVLYGELIFNLTEAVPNVFVLWSMQHDTGSMSLIRQSPTKACIELRDFEDRERDFCRVTAGYLREGLSMNDFADVAIAETACQLDGAERCAWRATWKRRS
jgi:predicted hydrocarbon binding protein